MIMQYTYPYQSPLGPITLSSDGQSLTGLWFDGQRYDQDIIKDIDTEEQPLPIFQCTTEWLDIYFSGRDPGFTPALQLSGSSFRQLVGEIMLTIPFGKTMTYGEIAKKVAAMTGKKKMSAQAVGGAVGHNPISLIIPCHRIVGTNGSLTGYGGGIQRKVWLLENEGINLKESGFYVPEKGTAL